MKLPTRDQLVKRRAIVLQDMAAKMEAEDFHGVADCAMDAREIDAMTTALPEQLPHCSVGGFHRVSYRVRMGDHYCPDCRTIFSIVKSDAD